MAAVPVQSDGQGRASWKQRVGHGCIVLCDIAHVKHMFSWIGSLTRTGRVAHFENVTLRVHDSAIVLSVIVDVCSVCTHGTDMSDDIPTKASAFDSVSKLLRLEDGYRSEEHTSELQSLMRTSYAVFCLQQKRTNQHTKHRTHTPMC